jgi:hypothetical protein
MDRVQSITAQASVKDPPCGFVLNSKTKYIKYKPAIIVKAESMY